VVGAESFASPVPESSKRLSETRSSLSAAQTPGHLHFSSKWGKTE